MTVFTCPAEPADYADLATVFLAGGITGCPDWQRTARNLLPAGVVALNPRRDPFPAGDIRATPVQVAWEVRWIARARVRMFWFPEPLEPHREQPISLLELGKVLMTDWPVAVGADPAYLRYLDVVLQCQHAPRKDIVVRTTLEDTCAEAVRLLAPSGQPAAAA